MDLGLKGRRALVIGGTSGLGLACCQALAEEGADIAVFARTANSLSTVSDSLKATYGVEVHTFQGDLTIRSDVARAVDELRSIGGIDILILNTPRPPSPMRDFLDEDDDDRWDRAYRDQLEGALNILRATSPLLIGKGWGRVIALTSATVKQPLPRHALSTIFRAGVQAALKHLSAELAPHGVTVNCVAPATILTPTFRQFHNLTARVRDTPLRRAGTMSELSSLVAFLSSDKAGFITGETIQLDGGRTASLL